MDNETNNWWKPIIDFEGYYYLDGNVLSESIRRGRVLKKYKNRDGKEFVKVIKEGKQKKLFIENIKVKE